MNTIEFDNNSLLFYETPWNNSILNGNTNEIDSINFNAIDSGLKLLKLFEEECIKSKIKYSAIRINSDNRNIKSILENSGYSNVETSMLVTSNINKIPKNPLFDKFKFSVQSATKSDLDTIKSISNNEFKYGRFFEDSGIPYLDSQQRNLNWIDDLYNKSNLMVGVINSNVFAFMAFKIKNGEAVLELGGVDSKYSHLAYPFWYKIFEHLKENKVKNVNALISASNLNVVNLYSKFEFRFSDVYFGYRKFRNL